MSPSAREDLELYILRSIQHHVKNDIPKYGAHHYARYIRRIQARGPTNSVTGPFQKALKCWWGACRILLCSLHDEAFFRAPHRYTVLHTYISLQEAHLALFSETVKSAQVPFSESQVQGTPPHYRDLWRIQIDRARCKLNRSHRFIRFGPPRPPVAILSPPCHLPVAVLALSAPCRSPVACLSLPCRCPVAPLSLSCRYPVAYCRFLSFPVAMLLFAWRLTVALLSLSCRSLLSLSCRYFLLPPCRPPVACLSSSCRLPVASLLPPCCLPVAQRGNLSLSCRLPVACLSLACRLPAASLSPPCRLPVAFLSPNVVTCRSPVACLSLACRLPVAFLSPPCCLPVASLSPNVLPYRWKAIDTSNRQFDSTKNVLCSCQIVRSHLSKPPQTCAKQ